MEAKKLSTHTNETQNHGLVPKQTLGRYAYRPRTEAAPSEGYHLEDVPALLKAAGFH